MNWSSRLCYHATEAWSLLAQRWPELTTHFHADSAVASVSSIARLMSVMHYLRDKSGFISESALDYHLAAIFEQRWLLPIRGRVNSQLWGHFVEWTFDRWDNDEVARRFADLAGRVYALTTPKVSAMAPPLYSARVESVARQRYLDIATGPSGLSYLCYVASTRRARGLQLVLTDRSRFVCGLLDEYRMKLGVSVGQCDVLCVDACCHEQLRRHDAWDEIALQNIGEFIGGATQEPWVSAVCGLLGGSNKRVIVAVGCHSISAWPQGNSSYEMLDFIDDVSHQNRENAEIVSALWRFLITDGDGKWMCRIGSVDQHGGFQPSRPSRGQHGHYSVVFVFSLQVDARNVEF
jgi:hypothetical protein